MPHSPPDAEIADQAQLPTPSRAMTEHISLLISASWMPKPTEPGRPVGLLCVYEARKRAVPSGLPHGAANCGKGYGRSARVRMVAKTLRGAG
jgi:hypothetical protein